jgi:hypothetical protein
VCPITSGEQVIGQFGLNGDDSWLWLDIFLLFVFYILFCISTYCALAFLFFKPTGSSVAKHDGDGDGDGEQQEPDQASESETLPLLATQINSSSSTVINIASHKSAFELQPVTLSFRDLNYTVSLSRSETKQLLFNIDGLVRPKTMVALMGASGAGMSVTVACSDWCKHRSLC